MNGFGNEALMMLRSGGKSHTWENFTCNDANLLEFLALTRVSGIVLILCLHLSPPES
jgi:hypothetical protein